MVELHHSKVVEGIAKMVLQERVEILPGESLLLEPGQYHLMLMNPIEPLTAGDAVLIQVQFEHGQKLDVTAIVKNVVQ